MPKITTVLLVIFATLFRGSAGAQQGPIVWHDTFKLASTSVKFKTTCYDSSTGIIFINVHENEATSLHAGKHYLSSEQKHCLVEMQHSRRRLISFKHNGKNYRVDPNRVFTTKGARATLKMYSPSYTKQVMATVNSMAEKFTKTCINNKALVVALHNNSNNDYSVKTYLSKASGAAAVFVNEKHDEDDFFFTTERQYFNFLKNKGFNVVLQHNDRAEDDGSLSIYCAQNKIPYINIEAEEGHLAEQKRMLELLDELIETTTLLK